MGGESLCVVAEKLFDGKGTGSQSVVLRGVYDHIFSAYSGVQSSMHDAPNRITKIRLSDFGFVAPAIRGFCFFLVLLDAPEGTTRVADYPYIDFGDPPSQSESAARPSTSYYLPKITGAGTPVCVFKTPASAWKYIHDYVGKLDVPPLEWTTDFKRVKWTLPDGKTQEGSVDVFEMDVFTTSPSGVADPVMRGQRMLDDFFIRKSSAE